MPKSPTEIIARELEELRLHYDLLKFYPVTVDAVVGPYAQRSRRPYRPPQTKAAITPWHHECAH